MAADLAGRPVVGLGGQLCGDAHLSNFGVLASPERRLLFDLNDVDDTMVVLDASRWNRRYHGWPLGTRGGPSTKDSSRLQRARLAAGDHADEIWFPGARSPAHPSRVGDSGQGLQLLSTTLEFCVARAGGTGQPYGWPCRRRHHHRLAVPPPEAPVTSRPTCQTTGTSAGAHPFKVMPEVEGGAEL
jgi:hypothetical protein